MAARVVARASVPAALLLALVSLVACGADGAAGDAPGHVVYLRFADGTSGITLGADDDARTDTSRLCATPELAAWGGAEGCGSRDACREEIRQRVASYFARYDVAFVTTRPSGASPYAMVVVAPPDGSCTFGERGVSYADCGDENARSVAFVFDCDRDPAVCAVLVAHEVGHTFGLVHVIAPDDIMTPAPADPALRFTDEERPASSDACGVTSQRSHDVLLAVLGPVRT